VRAAAVDRPLDNAVPMERGPGRPRTVLFLHGSAGGYGADRQLELLATGLDPARYRPLVVLPERGALGTKLEEAGIEVVVSPLAVLQRQLRRGRGAARTARVLARNVRELGELARRHRVSVVHSNYSLILCGQRVAERANAAHLLHVREIYADALWPLLRRRLLRADAVACVSEAVASRFPASERVFVLRDGLVREPPRVRRGDARRALGLDAETFVVASLGRVSDWKGQDVLVRALADPQLADVDAVALVAGDAAPHQRHFETDLADLAASLDLNGRVRLLGFRDDADVLLAAADAVAVTSIYPDSLPNSAIEGAAAGLPVVATDTGGQREIVRDGVTGTVVPPGDAAALADALRTLATDPLRAVRFGRAGADHVRSRFDPADALEALQDRYDRLSATRPTGPTAWLLPVEPLRVSHPAAPELRNARFARWLEELGYQPVVLARSGLRSAPGLLLRALRERPALVLSGAAVHAPALAAIRRLRRGRTRTIADVIGLHSLELDQASPRLRARGAIRALWMTLERMLVRNAQLAVTVNDRHAEIVRRRYREDRVFTLRDTAEPATGEPVDRASIGVPEGAVAIGFAGSLVYGRLDALFEAWEDVPNGWLVVVGDGPDLEWYRSRGPANAVLLGGLPHDRALAVLAACDVGYSDCWSEAGFPAKIFEYLALGLPIVTAATPQAREVLRDGHEALLYGSRAELVQHLARLVDDPALRTQLGAAARRTYAEGHSAAHRRREFEELVERAYDPLTFRRMTRADVARLFGLRSRWHGREWLERQARGEGHMAVVELDGVPVGRAGLDFAKGAPGIAYLSSGWVKRKLRSTGIGTALNTHLEEVARTRGYHAIQIDVNKANERAQLLYRRLGYDVSGEAVVDWSYRRLGRKIEVVEDCHVMRKPLYAAAERTTSAAISSSVRTSPSALSSSSSSG
jgi:glycosyltransferase involved in cell wall biosynthesis/L-amino acid N-acyltransferase YncA